MRLFILTALLTAVYVPTWGNPAVAQGIQTYERRFIGDIGYAEVDRRGNKIVVINPAVCQRLGPDLCSFFRAHEMAHHQLKHFDRNIPVQQKEAEADRHAASVVSPAARKAAEQFFASGRGGSQTHGSSQQRMARVSNTKQASQTKQSSQTSVATTTTKTATKPDENSTTSGRLNATRSVRQPQPRINRYCKCP